MSRRAWITTVLTVIAGGFAVRFGLTFPWAHTADMLAGSDWLLLMAASLANVLSLASKAAAWYFLLRPVARLRLGTAQAATFVGAAVNSISVSVSGEAARAQFIHVRDNVGLGTAAASLVVTRIVEALGLIVFLTLAFLFTPPWPGARPIGLALGAGMGVLLVGYHVMPWGRLHSRALGRWHETFIHMAATKDRAGLVAALVFATFGWVGQWLTYHWSIAATHVPVTLAVSLIALVMANLVGILRLTPGNIGVMQGSVILGMRGFDVPAADALAAGLALQAVEVLPVLVIGVGIVGTRGFRRLAARRSEAV